MLLALRTYNAVVSTAGYERDFANYYNVGARLLHGQWTDIYHSSSAIAGEQPLGWPAIRHYAGFPISAFLFTPLALLPAGTALLWFKAACVIAYLAGLVMLYRTLMPNGNHSWQSQRGLLVITTVGLLSEPFWRSLYAGGQATAFAFPLIVSFAAAYVRGHKTAAAVLLSAAVLLKPVLVVAGLVFLFAFDVRMLINLTVCAAAAAFASLALFGWDVHLQWFNHALMLGGPRVVPWHFNGAILGGLYDYWVATADTAAQGMLRSEAYTGPAAPAFIPIGEWLFRALLVVGMAVLCRQIARSPIPEADRRARIATLAVLLPLFYPTVLWRHYFSLLLIPLGYLVANWSRLPTGLRWGSIMVFVATLTSNTIVTHELRVRISVDTGVEAIAVRAIISSALIIMLLIVMIYRQRFVFAPTPPQST